MAEHGIKKGAFEEAVRLLCLDVHPTYIMGPCTLCVHAVAALRERGLLAAPGERDAAKAEALRDAATTLGHRHQTDMVGVTVAIRYLRERAAELDPT